NALITALTNYKIYQDKMKTDLQTKGMETLLKTKEKVCSDWKHKDQNGAETSSNECQEWSIKEILSMNIDNEIERYKKAIEQAESKKKTDDVNWFNTCSSNLEKLRAKREELLKQHPEYKTVMDYFKNLPNLQGQ